MRTYATIGMISGLLITTAIWLTVFFISKNTAFIGLIGTGIPIGLIIGYAINDNIEFKHLRNILEKVNKLSNDRNVNVLRSKSLNLFNKSQFIYRIDKQLKLIFDKYNLVFKFSHYTRWVIETNPQKVYKNIANNVEKLLEHFDVKARFALKAQCKTNTDILNIINKNLYEILVNELLVKSE